MSKFKPRFKPKKDTGNPYLRAAIMEVVDNQLEGIDPPETAQTLERLIAEGHSEEEAKNLIACVVSAEIFDIMKTNQPFNHAKFTAALHKLPELP